jgi:hypothetical protein
VIHSEQPVWAGALRFQLAGSIRLSADSLVRRLHCSHEEIYTGESVLAAFIDQEMRFKSAFRGLRECLHSVLFQFVLPEVH